MRRTRIFSRTSLVLKSFISYMAVFLLTFVFFNYIANQFFFREMEQKVKLENLKSCEKVLTLMDAQFSSLSAISSNIYNDYSFNQNNVDKSVPATKSGQTLLQAYLSGSQLLNSIAVYYTDLDKFYSPYRLYSTPEFQQAHLKEHFADSDVLRHYLSTTQTPAIFSQSDSNLIYVQPSSLFAPKDRLVLFTIEGKIVENYLTTSSGFVVLGNAHQQYLTSPQGKLIDYNLFQQLTQNMESSATQIVWIGEQKYIASYIASNYTGWNYLHLSPYTTAFQEIIALKQLYSTIIIVAFILVLALIAALCMVNMRPIHKLLRHTHRALGIAGDGNYQMDDIYHAIDDLSRLSGEIQQKNLNNRIALKEYLLNGLIKNRFANIQSFNDAGADIGVLFRLPYYCVCIFQFMQAADVTMENCKTIIDAIKLSPQSNLEIYGCDDLQNGRVFFIVATPTPSPQLFVEYLENRMGELSSSSKFICALGLGSSYDTIEMIEQSYIEASVAIDHCQVENCNSLTLYRDELRKARIEIDYPITHLSDLSIALRDGNVEKVHELLLLITQQIRSNSITIYTAKCICYDVVNTIIKELYNHGSLFTLDLELDVIKLASLHTTSELLQLLLTLDAQLTECLRSLGQDSAGEQERMAQEIITYIQHHFSSHTFSVSNISDQFKISPYKLNKIFNAYTGVNVSTYISNVRINEAKHLLSATDLSINQIVAQIGYFDTSNFVRKFRTEVGSTPGMYRKLFSP